MSGGHRRWLPWIIETILLATFNDDINRNLCAERRYSISGISVCSNRGNSNQTCLSQVPTIYTTRRKDLCSAGVVTNPNIVIIRFAIVISVTLTFLRSFIYSITRVGDF